MDAETAYSGPSSGSQPRPRQIILEGVPVDEPTQANFVDLLQQAIALLCQYVLCLLSALRVLRLQVIDLRCRAHYWEVQHERACERAQKLKAQLEQSQAQIRELERRLYGRKSETASVARPSGPRPAVKRQRGQQPGNPGPGRRNHDHLPTIDEPCTLPDDQQRCSCCGEPLEEIPGTIDGDLLEIEVRAHRRRYQRQRYRRRCTCSGPAIVTAPPPDKLIPKSSIGISIWVEILRRKFEFFTPLYRILAELQSHGLNLPSGTIIGGLQKLVPLFEPLYRLLVEHNRRAGHWHCDETRWPVFVKRPDKAGFAWNLWVFAAADSVVFVLDPTRAHEVPEGYFGWGNDGILSVDRYSAYKAMRQVKDGELQLAFCWAHVRRDFLEILTGWHELTDWAWSWVEMIGELYYHNNQRRAVLDDPAAYALADHALRQHVDQMRQRCTDERAQPNLRLPQSQALNSLHNHWEGLTLFVDHPHVPLDNNTAERAHRGPVLGRKNFYGSGSLGSGRLAAMLFSLFQTIRLWQMDVRAWLSAYLSAWARSGGQLPAELHRYLPWNMSDECRQEMRLPKTKPPNPTLDPSPPKNHPETA